jgi:acetyltransferase-like isoleucine patch superfamily enzyme
MILKPLKIEGAKNISIGKKSVIQYKTWLAAVPLTGEKECKIVIGNGCAIGNFNHIYATKSIVIENCVLTADKVYISDNLHGYENPDIPVIQQPIKQISEVIIGEGSWLGENVCVIGAKIGKHCVVGANSVVTKDIPDYCVVAGVPAKVIKQYNFETKRWERS